MVQWSRGGAAPGLWVGVTRGCQGLGLKMNSWELWFSLPESSPTVITKMLWQQANRETKRSHCPPPLHSQGTSKDPLGTDPQMRTPHSWAHRQWVVSSSSSRCEGLGVRLGLIERTWEASITKPGRRHRSVAISWLPNPPLAGLWAWRWSFQKVEVCSFYS